MGELEARHAEPEGELDGLGQRVEVLAMQDDIQREGRSRRGEEPRRLELFDERSTTGDAIGGGGLGSLNAELDVFEAGVEQPLEARPIERNATRDEVRVEPCLSSPGNDDLEIVSDEGLATREVNLNDAELARLCENPRPLVDRELSIDARRIPPDSSNKGTRAGSDN